MAMSKPVSLKDELEDELTCTVCMEQYNSNDKLPKLLPCGHTFCLTCVIQYADKQLDGTFKCPVCKQSSKVNHNDIDQLPNNFMCLSLLDRMKKVQPATAVDKVICVKHEKDCEHFCMTCKQGLCGQCLTDIATKRVDTHIDHKILPVSQALTERAAELKILSSNIKDASERLSKEHANAVSNFHQLVDENIERCKAQVVDAHKQLDAWEFETVKKLQKAKQEYAREDQYLEGRAAVVRTRISEALDSTQNGDINPIYQDNNIDADAAAICKDIDKSAAHKPDIPTITLDNIQMTLGSVEITTQVIPWKFICENCGASYPSFSMLAKHIECDHDCQDDQW